MVLCFRIHILIVHFVLFIYSYGIFRLTDPPGIGVISKCPQRGFHQHPTEKPIYTKCSDKHVQLETLISLETIDLRYE